MARAAVRTLLLALVVAHCTGCSGGAVDRSELIGDFAADYGFGVESLRFASDGHYDQLFRVTGEDTWTTNSSTWEFKNDAAAVILLHDSLKVFDDSGKLASDYRKPVPGIRTLQVKKSMRTISIDDASSGRAFRKL